MTRKKINPKQPRKKKTYAFSFDGALKGMKSGDILYARKEDKDVTARTASLWLSGQFKTERVIVVHMKSWDTEKWVLITKL